MPVEATDFRDVMGRFASGVTVVTTAQGGRLDGFTASSFSSVSLDPPLVLVCLGHESACHDSFLKANCFAVNILAAGQVDLSVRFSTAVGNRFEGISHSSWVTGAPVLDGVVAAIDCRMAAIHEAGDHSILIGHVERLGPVAEDAEPLLYYRGRYHALG